MTTVQQLATFTRRASYDMLSEAAREQLMIRILDALGCALGALSHWKGLAYPEMGFTATRSAFLARRGIIGPPEVFEGNKGFIHSIAGAFEIDWQNENPKHAASVCRRTV